MLESVVKICLDAGRHIMQYFHGRKICYVNKKEDCSPVTSADLFSNYVIFSSLQKITPDIPILSEENVFLWRKNENIDCLWIVDPLDGTKEFLLRSPEFTINVALIEKGIPVMGVVYAPAMGTMYVGCNNQAWRIDVNTQYRLRVSTRKSYPPVVVISRFHNDYKQLNDYLMHLINYRIIIVGSSLKFCLVAEGSAQLYPRFSCTNVWDIAAGHAIALSAGASVTDWNGVSLNYNNLGCSFLNFGFQVSSF